MSADIIPAELDRGEFRITDQMMYETGTVSLQAFETLIREEAYRRGLDLLMLVDDSTRDVIVRWRPGQNRH
jgi:hypothetical protein